MPLSPSPDPRREAFAGLRASLAKSHGGAAPAAFSPADGSLLRTGFPEIDAALGGGIPRGIIATLEGAPGSGRSAFAARLLAGATWGGGLGALIESPAGPEGAFYPPALAAAGVALERLLVIPAHDTTGAARAADILLRSAAFGVVAIPMLALPAAAWTRLASLAHRANAVLLALGGEASDELRYFASLRVRLRPRAIRWAGAAGLFGALAGTALEATVLKHKRAAPGKRATFDCTSFETGNLPVIALRERPLLEHPATPQPRTAQTLAV
jgi:hypothetical protein